MTADMPPITWQADEGWENASNFWVSTKKINENEDITRASYRFNDNYAMSYLRHGNDYRWNHGFEFVASYKLSPKLTFKGSAFYGQDENQKPVKGGGVELVLFF